MKSRRQFFSAARRITEIAMSNSPYYSHLTALLGRVTKRCDLSPRAHTNYALTSFILFLIISPSLSAQNALPSLGDRISGTVSLEQEFTIGQQFLASIRRGAPTIPDPLLNNYLENVTSSPRGANCKTIASRLSLSTAKSSMLSPRPVGLLA